jgi:hypothetical protein
MTYTDERLQPGTYYYRVRSSNAAGTSRPTNVDSITITGGESPTVIDHGNGFTTHNDLTANGRARFTPNADPVGIFPGHQDIGTVTSRGSATFDGLGTYTLNASGGDIWNTTDEFHYVYKPLTGDGEIVARAVSIQNTDFWAKGGVMIRETLAADSKNAFMFETPSGHNEPVFQYRANTAGGSADYDNHINNLQAAPVWLRLARLGDSFSGYWAQDLGGGLHGDWHQIGQTTTIPMATTVYVGLALTAHNNDGRINTSMFDNVTITGTTSDTLAASAARLTDGGFSEAGSVFSNNRLGATNFTTKFTFQMTPGTTPMADGMAFVIQGVGPTALGPGGGGLGYGSDTVGGAIGIAKSVAIKFDIYNNAGEGINSTGIFTDGRSPTVRQPGLSSDFPDQSVNLDGSGINLASTHPFRVTLTYDGTTLTEQILDTVTSVRFTTSYVVNIPSLVGSNVAYAGFTGGTGGLTTVIDVQSWTMKSTLPRRGASGSSTTAAPESAPLATSTASGSTTSASAMLVTKGSSKDGADAADPSGMGEDWLDAVAAATTGDNESDSAGDELFAQLADEGDLLHVLGTNGKSKS